jgi:alpha-amylase
LGVLLQGFFFSPERIHGVPSPLDGDYTVPFWWDHLAAQANDFSRAGFTAIWIPPPLKGASGSFTNGYDVFDERSGLQQSESFRLDMAPARDWNGAPP